MTEVVDTGKGFMRLTYDVSSRPDGGGARFFKEKEEVLESRPTGQEVVSVAAIGYRRDS